MIQETHIEFRSSIDNQTKAVITSSTSAAAITFVPIGEHGNNNNNIYFDKKQDIQDLIAVLKIAAENLKQ